MSPAPALLDQLGAVVPVAGGGGGTPPVAGYHAWYDASDAASITASGGLVSQWNDKGPSGYHLTATSTARPTTGTRTIGGRNALEFNGANHLRNAAWSFASASFTVLAVVLVDKAVGAGPGRTVVSMADSVTGIDYNAATRARVLYDDDNTDVFASYYAGSAVASVADTAAAVQLTTKRATTTWTPYKNGAAGGPAGIGGTALAVGAMFVGAALTGTPSDFWGGLIAELVFYLSALNDTDRGTVESYLKTKWGTP